MVRVECRDGTQHLWLSPIVRSKDAVFLSDAIELDEPVKGRFGTFFGVSGSES
jgi:hypothetical protein